MKKEALFVLLLFVLSFNLISAQPPFQQSERSIGIVIESPIIEYREDIQEFSFYIHTHNATTGLILRNDTTNCIIHIYRPSDGKHIIEENMSFDNNNIDFEFEVLKGNFTEIGQYSVLFYCEVEDEIGGFLEYPFFVTPDGNFIRTGESIMYIWILIVLAALATLGIWLSIIIPYENISLEGSAGEIILKITMTKYFKLITIWITSGIILLFTTVLTGMINNYVQFVATKVLFTNIYTLLNILGWVTTVIIMVFLFLNIWKDIVFNKQIIKDGKAFINENARRSS